MDVTSERLKHLREQLGYSQSQLNYLDGVGQVTVSKWEAGNVPKSLDMLARLARRYKTTTDYLLGLTDDPAPRSAPSLTEDERELVDVYAELSPGHQRDLLAIAAALRNEEIEQETVTAQLDWQERVLNLLEKFVGEEAADQAIAMLLAADAELLEQTVEETPPMQEEASEQPSG